MGELSRYFPQEAAAIQGAALEAAQAASWPGYLTQAIPALFALADDRTDPGDGSAPLRGAWLAALAALWVADLDDDEIPPGYQKVSSLIGDAANRALAAEYLSRSAPSAFARVWAEAVKAAGSVARLVAEVGAGVGEQLADIADKSSKRALWAGGLVVAGLAIWKFGGSR